MNTRLAFLLLFVATLYGFYSPKVKSAKLELDRVYSSDTKAKLISFFEEKAISMDLQSLSKEMSKFDVVARVELDLRDPKVNVVRVYGINPKLKVNNDFILGENGKMLAPEDFVDYKEPLVQVSVAEEFCSSEDISSVYQFLQKVPCEILSRYNINYQDKRNIVLTPRDKEKKYSVLVDEDSIFDEKKLACVDSIGERGKMLDLRFRGRIIARSRNRSYYG